MRPPTIPTGPERVRILCLGLSAAAFAGAVDSMLGIGGAAWLVDLCLSTPMTEDEMAVMAAPDPTSASLAAGVSLAAWTAILHHPMVEDLLVRPHKGARQAAILTAICRAAIPAGRIEPGEVRRVVRLVSGQDLRRDMAEAVAAHVRRFARDGAPDGSLRLARFANGRTRREVLAAAVLTADDGGRVAGPDAEDAIMDMMDEIGATASDALAVGRAVAAWREGGTGGGVSKGLRLQFSTA